MSILDIIDATIIIIRATCKIAKRIYDTKKFHPELQETANRITDDLNTVEGALDQLRHFAHRIIVTDEILLLKHMESLNPVIDDVKTLLEDVGRERNFIQRLFMRNNEYQRKLHDLPGQLHRLCGIIQRTIPATTKIQVPIREFLDFRKAFQNIPEKDVSFYNFSIIENTPHTILTITLAQFDAMRSLCYMKAGNEKIFLSYQLRTWSALNPIKTVLEHRRNKFARDWHNRSVPNLAGSNSSLNSVSSTHS